MLTKNGRLLRFTVLREGILKNALENETNRLKLTTCFDEYLECGGLSAGQLDG